MSTLPRSESADFPWWGDDQDIVLQDQPATAVYPNRHGGVVIRQQRQWDEEGDTTIIIGRENAIRIVYAILRAAGHEDIQIYRTNGIGCEDVPDPADHDFRPSDGDEEEQDREPDEHQNRQIEFGREPKDAVAAIPALTAEVEIATSSLPKEENRLIGNGSKPKAAERHKAKRDRKTDLATTSYNGTAAPDENGKEIAPELFATETAS